VAYIYSQMNKNSFPTFTCIFNQIKSDSQAATLRRVSDLIKLSLGTLSRMVALQDSTKIDRVQISDFIDQIDVLASSVRESADLIDMSELMSYWAMVNAHNRHQDFSYEIIQDQQRMLDDLMNRLSRRHTESEEQIDALKKQAKELKEKSMACVIAKQLKTELYWAPLRVSFNSLVENGKDLSTALGIIQRRVQKESLKNDQRCPGIGAFRDNLTKIEKNPDLALAIKQKSC
jgi:hypothetical protein